MIRFDEIDIQILEDLQQRLVADYNGDEEFEQYEEDRLELGKVLDYLKVQATNKKRKLYNKYQGFAYLDGFAYLVHIVENYDELFEMVDVYEEVGKHFNKTASAIERAIRNFRSIVDTEEPSKTNKAFIVKNMFEVND